MSSRNLPEISVVVFMPHHFTWLAPLLRALRAQTASQDIELVVVVRSLSTFAAGDEVLHGFNRSLIVEASARDTDSTAKLVGLGSATAPIVAFAEDHCFPRPDWAEILIRAHGGDCVAVAPAMINANPGSALSRALFALHFGKWSPPVPAGEMPVLPPHNTSYKRAVLLAIAGELPRLAPVEQFLQARIRSTGQKIVIEPAAVIAHCNVSKLSPWCRTSYYGGRLYGATRAAHESWTLPQRVVRGVTSPLVIVARLMRDMTDIRKTAGSGATLVTTIFMGIAHLVLHTAGEAMGYVAGAGDSETACVDLETSRFRDMSDTDLAGLRASAALPVLKPAGMVS